MRYEQIAPMPALQGWWFALDSTDPGNPNRYIYSDTEPNDDTQGWIDEDQFQELISTASYHQPVYQSIQRLDEDAPGWWFALDRTDPRNPNRYIYSDTEPNDDTQGWIDEDQFQELISTESYGQPRYRNIQQFEGVPGWWYAEDTTDLDNPYRCIYSDNRPSDDTVGWMDYNQFQILNARAERVGTADAAIPATPAVEAPSGAPGSAAGGGGRASAGQSDPTAAAIADQVSQQRPHIADMINAGDTQGAALELLDWFWARPFQYRGGGGKLSMWSGQGDCTTLVLEFIAILNEWGIPAEKRVVSAGPLNRIYVWPQRAIGASEPGNIGGNGWIFEYHTLAVVAGTQIDVLFGQLGGVGHAILRPNPEHPLHDGKVVSVYSCEGINVALDKGNRTYRYL